MGLIQEFKEFAVKGNVIDLAVGVIIGAAFGDIVKVLVDKVVMPPIGYLIKGIDFSSLAWTIGTSTDKDGKEIPVKIEYGLFLNSMIHFFIIALVVFIVIKQFNRLRKSEKELPPTMRKCPMCMEDISVEAKRCSHCTSEVVPA